MRTCVIARYTLNVGNIRERGTPFIGTLTGFASAYPTVERAYVRFTEMDFVSNPRERVHNLADGPRAACSNPLCERGGYDFEFQVMEMVHQGIETEAVEISCRGDEGTPKGRRRGKDCSMSMSGTITIQYKKSALPENDDEVRKD
jgi:hypothetical protein